MGHIADYLKAEYQHIYTAVHGVLLLGQVRGTGCVPWWGGEVIFLVPGSDEDIS